MKYLFASVTQVVVLSVSAYGFSLCKQDYLKFLCALSAGAGTIVNALAVQILIETK